MICSVYTVTKVLRFTYYFSFLFFFSI